MNAASLAQEFAAWYTNAAHMIEDPYPFLHRLRRESPIHSHGGVLFLSRHADCAAAALSPALWKTDGKGYDYGSMDRGTLPARSLAQLDEIFTMERLALNKTEGEQHDRIRGLVQRAFTPKTIDAFAAPLHQLAHELLDEVVARATGQMDAIEDFAYQLPIITICRMLEVPIADRRRLREWTMEIMALFAGEREDLPRVIETALVHRKELFAYLRDVIDRRRAAGGDPDSVVSILLAAEHGDRLSTEELVANTALFVLAGHETTTNAIGNSLVALLQHRDQWDLLCSDPTLARNAAEEGLRYISPVQTEPRYATREAKIGELTVREGQRVRMLWGAANRDPAQFGDPDRFDIARSVARHLAFGIGKHHCLGSALARLEITTALRVLSQRFPRMRMLESKPRWRQSFNIRAVSALPVELGPDAGRSR